MQYFYFISLFFSVVLVHNSVKDNKFNSYIYYWFVLVVALVLGLRGNEDEYTRVYVLIPTLDVFFSSGHDVINEKGLVFSLISSFFKTFGLNSQSIFLFFSGVGVFLHAKYFQKFTRYYFLSFLLYLSHEICFKEWVGLRMGLASAMLLPMIHCLYNDQKVKFLCLVVAATLIQYVAVLSIILLFLNRKIKPRLLWLGLLFAVAILQLNIVSTLVHYLSDLGFLPDIVVSYLSAESYVYDVGLTHPKTIQQIITVSVMIILFGYKKEVISVYYNLLFNAYYLSTIFLILFAELALFAFRFGGHFYSVEPILVTYIVVTCKQRTLVANLLSILALIIAYVNYVIVGRVSEYDFLVNYPV
ncbi:MAG: EpsG family protein [Cellvibrionaceae bacterium]